ncbi:helix-turn-helix domain-containing protein [Pseudomonas sp. MWU15-20650]|uniref:helix-turn-helix domain-containing protein n=1 Tax=Pseudomonas sp. MWU15-20650 TaxID=2933107 RepID=UPI0024B1E450|nr:helix-turn-helix domain-containing protein [Pseudomonas sp. MWU15-20650]
MKCPESSPQSARAQSKIRHIRDLLILGQSVQTVALDLGDANASGFITLFRKAVGQPPARYLAVRMAVAGHQSQRGIAMREAAE